MSRRLLARPALLLALATSSAHADVFIVDKNDGPNTDFLDMPAAVTAAVDGDILIVRTGVYAGFDVDEALTIIAVGTVRVYADIVLENLPAGQTLQLSGFDPVILRIRDAEGTVIVDDAPASTIAIERCADVRLERVSTRERLVVDDSHVEIVDSVIEGGYGEDSYPGGSGDDGSDALTINGASEVHVAGTWVEGGTGGDAYDCWSWPGATAPSSAGRSTANASPSRTRWARRSGRWPGSRPPPAPRKTKPAVAWRSSTTSASSASRCSMRPRDRATNR